MCSYLVWAWIKPVVKIFTTALALDYIYCASSAQSLAVWRMPVSGALGPKGCWTGGQKVSHLPRTGCIMGLGRKQFKKRRHHCQCPLLSFLLFIPKHELSKQQVGMCWRNTSSTECCTLQL